VTADTVPFAAGARTAIASLTRSPARRYALVLALFLLLTILWMWPLVTHLNDRILQGPTDAASSIRGYWADAEQGKTPFTTTHDALVVAPEGIPEPGALAVAQPVQNGVIWLLEGAVGYTAAFNLFLLAGFVLTGFAAFVFLERIGLRPVAALFGAYVIAFNPWTFARALAGHAAFLHIWVLILLAGALLMLDRRPTIRRAAVAGLAYGLTFQLAAYWGLLASLLVVVFYVVEIVRRHTWGDRLWVCTLACCTGAALLLTLVPALLAYHDQRSVVQQSIGHPVSQLREFAATIPSYLVPNRRQPVLGFLGRDLITGKSKDVYSERSLFFGWTTLALAALVVGLRIRRPRIFDGLRMPFAVLLFAVVAPVALITSVEPQVDIAGLKIPTPSRLLAQVTTYYRVYARFGIVFGLGVAVLAAVAVDLLLRRRNGLAWTGALFALTVAQLLPGAIPTWAADRPPAWDAWLAKAPPGIVAQYPILADDAPSQTLGAQELYYQRFYHHPLYNMTLGTGTLVSREGAVRLLSRNLTDAATPGILSAEHVRYVVVHDDVYRQEGTRPPVLDDHFEQVAAFGAVRIFVLLKTSPADLDSVIEQNASLIAQLQDLEPGTVDTGSGFYAGEKYAYAAGASATGLWHWMQQDGELVVNVPDQPGVRYTLSGQGFSSMTPRSVDLVTGGGTVLAHTELPPNLVNVTFGPLPISPGKHRLYLHAQPNPAPLGGGDTRIASVFLSPLQLQPLPDLTSLNAGS
jgi:hypothetical protein